MYSKFLVISFSVIFLLGFLVANAQLTTLTILSIDPVPKEVATGDEIVFSGTLTDINGNYIVGKTIRIQQERTTSTNILASVTTDENGTFTTTWTADLDNPTKDRFLTIFASFEGDDQYRSSISVRAVTKVAIQTMKVSIKLDKQMYYNGDIATFTIKFANPIGEPLDPEMIRTFYDDKVVSLERENEGIYKFKTAWLIPPKHTLQLIAEKYGYEVYTNAITLDVSVRKSLIAVKLDFDWSPKQALQGESTIFSLYFSDTNNVVIPFVDYDFIIKKNNEAILELKGEQTTYGRAMYEHIFTNGGKHTITVKINNIGQASDLKPIKLSSDFNIDVIKRTTFAVNVKSMQKVDAMRITFRNPVLFTSEVYAFNIKFDDASKVKISTPIDWNLKTINDVITIYTENNPLEPGKKLRLRVNVDGNIDSFDWNMMNKDDNILESGTSKVLEIRFKQS